MGTSVYVTRLPAGSEANFDDLIVIGVFAEHESQPVKLLIPPFGPTPTGS